ncbi:hypothetical protein Vadar_029257 [Vaccinium darrowii]|uniref:Uncharacterized protein n=1 Tax=Vaccinium darrowii TaxID=229202 RepID=A0ACB7YHZ2_9ERIC|nr:hypothetical protein Vadar_029257 [Vaccinium darrowii]
MRSLSAAILLLSLLFLVAKFGDARKDPIAADYWKSMMRGSPIPRAIEEVLVHDQDGETSVSKQKEKKLWDPSQTNMAHFRRDFETTHNVLIYHSHNNMGHGTTP